MAGPPGWRFPVPSGGFYGNAKWSGGNGLDIFVRQRTPVFAPANGFVSPANNNQGPFGPVPSFTFTDGRYTAEFTHVQMSKSGQVRQGDIIGYVGDPSLNILGPYQGMPDNFQHVDLRVGQGSGPFDVTGGNINVLQWMQSVGYQGTNVGGVTRGPNGGPQGIPGPFTPIIPGMPIFNQPGLQELFPPGAPPFGGLPLPGGISGSGELQGTDPQGGAIDVGPVHIDLSPIQQAIAAIGAPFTAPPSPLDWSRFNAAWDHFVSAWKDLFKGGGNPEGQSSGIGNLTFPQLAIALIVLAVFIGFVENFSDSTALAIALLTILSLFLTTSQGAVILENLSQTVLHAMGSA